MLVFLPGAREIRRVQALLGAEAGAAGAQLLPLFGELSAAAQDAALAPAAAGCTQGRARHQHRRDQPHHPRRARGGGLRTGAPRALRSGHRHEPPRDAAHLARLGRAAPAGAPGGWRAGVCYRAWSEGAHASLAAFTPPEIAEADLAPLALELASWGTRRRSRCAGSMPPPAAMLASAARPAAPTRRARRRRPHHRTRPRDGASRRAPATRAHVAARARARRVPLAAQLAALLSERDLLRGGAGARDADIRTRLELLRGEGGRGGADRAILERTRRAARDLERGAARRSGPGSGSGAERRRAARLRLPGSHRPAPPGRARDATRSPTAAARHSPSRRRWRARSSSWRSTSMTASARRASCSPRRCRARSCWSTAPSACRAPRRSWLGQRASRRCSRAAR